MVILYTDNIIVEGWYKTRETESDQFLLTQDNVWNFISMVEDKVGMPVLELTHGQVEYPVYTYDN
jgi:hypothetical protein